MTDLPTTSEHEQVYSSSTNDDMVGPLTEKVVVGLHFVGDYESSHGILPSTALRILSKNYYKEFPNVSVDMPFEISEVVNHGWKTNSPMIVVFKKTPRWKLQDYYCDALLGIRDNFVET